MFRVSLQTKFIPFNPNDKYTIATITPNNGDKPFRLMKGAPQVLSLSLEDCWVRLKSAAMKGRHAQDKVTCSRQGANISVMSRATLPP